MLTFSTNSNVNGYEVENFPMPPKNLELQKSIEQLVDIVLRTKSENHACTTTQLEHEIDKKVYELYGLSPEEIAVVENNFNAAF